MSSDVTGTVGVGVGPRAVAIIIDGIIFYIVGYILALVSGDTDGISFSMDGAPACLYFLIAIAYYPVMEVLVGGTVGKMVMGLKVVKEDGSPLDWGAGIIRTLLRIIDALPAFYLLAAILVWTSPRKQRLGDRVAKTLVVKKGAVVTQAASGQF